MVHPWWPGRAIHAKSRAPFSIGAMMNKELGLDLPVPRKIRHVER